jgi:hypothetical protein
MNHGPDRIKEKKQNETAKCFDIDSGTHVSAQGSDNPDNDQNNQGTTSEIDFRI